MRFVLEIQSGSLAGSSIALVPGQIAQVGRSGWADLRVTGDPALADLHFLIEAGRSSCLIRDLSSPGGTFLNDRRINQAPLQPGDRIRAGATEFVFRGADPAAVAASPAAVAASPAEAPAPPLSPIATNLLAVLRGAQSRLFAILDAARDPLIYALLIQAAERHQSLYEGPEGEQLALVAPHLVELPPASPLLATLARDGWGRSWGVFLTCSQPFEAVRKHLRHFLLVKTEAGKELYFRFYDPRVLRVFLPTCTPREAQEFFGPIEAFLLEAEQPDTLLVLTLAPSGVQRASRSLAGAGPASARLA